MDDSPQFVSWNKNRLQIKIRNLKLTFVKFRQILQIYES
jgi:hypothetical protein